MIFKDGKHITRIFKGDIEVDRVFTKGREVFSALESKAIVNAINNRAATEGFDIPSVAVQRAMSQYIQGMIDKGFWDKFDLFLNFAFNQLGLNGYRRINWKNPSGNIATLYGGLQDTLKGIGGNGVNAYVDTNHNMLTNSINYTRDDAGVGVVNYSVPLRQNENTEVFFSYGSEYAPGIRLTFRNGTPIPVFINTTIYGTLPMTVQGIGYKSLNRYSLSSFSLINKETMYNNTANSESVQSRTLKLLTSNNGFSTFGISSIHTGSSFTFEEGQAFRALTNKFLTSIGLDAFA